MSFHILGHHFSTRAFFHPKTRWQHFLYNTKPSWVLKSRFGKGWFSTFLAPLLLIFSKGNGPNGVSDHLTNDWVVLPHFCCNDILYWNSYINDSNQVSGWWEMREWWWKVGFTPRKIRHWSPSWQYSSSGATSSPYSRQPLGVELIFASPGNHTQFTFQKYPHWGLPLTLSEVVNWAKVLRCDFLHLNCNINITLHLGLLWNLGQLGRAWWPGWVWGLPFRHRSHTIWPTTPDW